MMYKGPLPTCLKPVDSSQVTAGAIGGPYLGLGSFFIFGVASPLRRLFAELPKGSNSVS